MSVGSDKAQASAATSVASEKPQASAVSSAMSDNGRARQRPALVVAGPTCSGKSALALAVAQHLGGTVLNADSMQLYAELRVLTARPTPAEEALAPHTLYGVLPAARAGTVAWWRQAALAAMEDAHAQGRLPILCGGTGLYLAALSQGLADIPDPGAPARAEARDLLREVGPAALHARLAQADPATAATLRPTDGQRLARAWEVWRGTGTGLSDWQSRQAAPAFPWTLHAIILDPPRAELRAAIAARFRFMLDHGAVDEVRALLAQGLDPALPAMRAHGVPELAAVLRGTATLRAASDRAVLLQGQYTKRQDTWFAHHPLAGPERTRMIGARMAGMTQQLERILPDLLSFVVEGVDAGRRDA